MKITSKCNSHCRQCDVWKRTTPADELDTEQWKELISKLKKWIGPFYLNIYGGEPFLRNDLFEIIDFAHSKNVFTDVITNSLLLLDRIEELNNSHLSKLTISLDGATAKTHDFLRGRGSFEKIVTSIATLQENRKDLIVTINNIMLKQNFHELPALVHFVKANKLNGIYLRILCCEGFSKNYSKDWFLKSPLWPADIKKVEKILEKLIQLKKKGYPIINSTKYLDLAKEYFRDPNSKEFQKLTCLTPYECLTVLTKGQAMLCARYYLGNILEDNLPMIWKSKKLNQLRRSLLDCKKSCMIRDSCFEDTIKSKLSRARLVLFGK